jgi:Uma2 family endonuclease
MAMPLPASPPSLLPRFTLGDLDALPDDGQRYEILQGHLLVTPQAGFPHQVIAARLTAALVGYLDECAHVVGPGAIQRPPDIHLEPDLLVVPPTLPETMAWADFTGHWLAVEIYSHGSRIYDHDYKRDAYLALGVREVWLVDRRERSILVSTGQERDRRVSDTLHWQPPEMNQPFELPLERLFRKV